MAENCLKLSLEVISDILNLGVMVVDDRGALSFATPLACELFGYQDFAEAERGFAELKSALPLTPDHFIHPSKPLRVTRSFKVRGRERTLRMEIHPLVGESCPGLLLMVRDRQSLDAIDINLLLASRMRTQAYLHGALSHDMKIPLNAMQITLELLADTLADLAGSFSDERAARGERHIAALREEFMRLRCALETSAGLNKPTGPMHRQSFDLRDLVREVVGLLQSQARRQDVAVEAQLPDSAVIMLGPQDWIKQVLLNIAVNRLEAMTGEGRLAICVGRSEDAAVVQISVDVAAMADEAFDATYQVRFSPTTGDGAFGLNIARAIVESLGGEFLIERDAGTCFRLTLPLH